MKLWKLVLVLIAISASGCGFTDYKNPGSSNPTTSAPVGTNPGGGTQTGGGGSTQATFSAVSSQVLQPNCTGCHSGSSPSGGVDLSTYSGVMAVVSAGNPSGSRIYTAVSGGIMPPGGSLPQSDIDLIGSWIQNGALNN